MLIGAHCRPYASVQIRFVMLSCVKNYVGFTNTFVWVNSVKPNMGFFHFNACFVSYNTSFISSTIPPFIRFTECYCHRILQL